MLDRGKIARRLLVSLGLDDRRIIEIDDGDWVFGAVLLYPPPVHHDDEMYPADAIIDTAAVLRERAMDAAEMGDRPVMVLLERALLRERDGKCGEQRCLKNFKDVKERLEREFSEYEVIVFRADDGFGKMLRLFGEAEVVVGVHGAGFQNIMFCRRGTTVVHLGFDGWYRSLGEQFGLNFHSVYLRNLKRGSKNYVLKDLDGLVRNVSKAIAGKEAWRASEERLKLPRDKTNS